MEIWDVYDIHGNKLNKTIVRDPKNKLGKGEYHMGSCVFIRDENDNFLIQQRSFKKDLYPGKWSITGGSAVSGENEVQCAIREVNEELGITLKPQDLTKIYHFIKRKCLFNVFVAYASKNSKITRQDEEVEQTAWVSRQQMLDLYNQGEFMLPYIDRMLKRIK